MVLRYTSKLSLVRRSSFYCFTVCISLYLDEDIDGTALMGLREEDILKLLSTINEDETRKRPTLRIQRKFRTILEEYRSLVKHEKKKTRKNR